MVGMPCDVGSEHLRPSEESPLAAKGLLEGKKKQKDEDEDF
jgi:hypothetical protein